MLNTQNRANSEPYCHGVVQAEEQTESRLQRRELLLSIYISISITRIQVGATQGNMQHRPTKTD